MWYGGTATSAASSAAAPPNSTDPTMYEKRWRCRSTAALGAPVVPLVKRRTAMASGSADGPAPVPSPARALSMNSSRRTTVVRGREARPSAWASSVMRYAGSIRSTRASSSAPVSR